MPHTKQSLPHWRRAHGDPLFPGVIRQSASDFEVVEELGFDLDGIGEHDFLWLEKENANTQWVAHALAEHAGVPNRDVGFAGLKDRHAVTRQWFSVRRRTGGGTDWRSFELPDAQILWTKRHQRKLKRGAHLSNRFRIAIRGRHLPESAIVDRLNAIRKRGVPNYFGEQRFGRGGANLQLARDLFRGRRMNRDKRGYALSAVRSFLYNEILSDRVRTDCWDEALPGEAFNLDGSNSIFVADEIEHDLRARLTKFDIHPTAALWGAGEIKSRLEAAVLDRKVCEHYPDLVAGLEKHGVRQARRATRVAVRELTWIFEADVLWLVFRLRRGSFATAVLREIVDY